MCLRQIQQADRVLVGKGCIITQFRASWRLKTIKYPLAWAVKLQKLDLMVKAISIHLQCQIVRLNHKQGAGRKVFMLRCVAHLQQQRQHASTHQKICRWSETTMQMQDFNFTEVCWGPPWPSGAVTLTCCDALRAANLTEQHDKCSCLSANICYSVAAWSGTMKITDLRATWKSTHRSIARTIRAPWPHASLPHKFQFHQCRPLLACAAFHNW